jgi:hypothetical protein
MDEEHKLAFSIAYQNWSNSTRLLREFLGHHLEGDQEAIAISDALAAVEHHLRNLEARLTGSF